jgi:hypothetical protein
MVVSLSNRGDTSLGTHTHTHTLTHSVTAGKLSKVTRSEVFRNLIHYAFFSLHSTVSPWHFSTPSHHVLAKELSTQDNQSNAPLYMKIRYKMSLTKSEGTSPDLLRLYTFGFLPVSGPTFSALSDSVSKSYCCEPEERKC